MMTRLLMQRSIKLATHCYAIRTIRRFECTRYVSSSASRTPYTQSGKALLAIYAKLSKARLSALVAVSSSAGFLAAGSPLDFKALIAVTVGTWLTAASASCANQIIEIKSDALMKRTRLRPLPSGRISISHAKKFCAVAGISGLSMLMAGTNTLTTTLAAANWVMYTTIYTPLKKRSWINTEIGSLVGAVPPVMGWTAATGTLSGTEPLALATLLFLWQMPHFLSLAWMLRLDYNAGGYQMLSRCDASGKLTSRSSLLYSLLLVPLPFVTTVLGMTSHMFAVDGSLANICFAQRAYRFHVDPSMTSARSVFKTSLWHLPLILSLFAFHKIQAHVNENGSVSTEAALDLPELHDMGRALCIHETLVKTNENNSTGIGVDLVPADAAADIFSKTKL